MSKVCVTVAVALAAAATVFEAALAHADTNGYLAGVQKYIPNVYERYGGDALLKEGNKVCDWAAQGVPGIGSSTPGGDIVDRIMADLPMSSDAAVWVKVIAQNELGC